MSPYDSSQAKIYASRDEYQPERTLLAAGLRRALSITVCQLGLLAGFCSLFMYYSFMPLAVTDLWGHVAYGNWMIDHGRLPIEEPFVELAAGIPLVNTAWLGQLLLAGAGRFGNSECYRLLHATTVLMIYLTLIRAFFLQTRHLGIATIATAYVAWAVRLRNSIIRPETFGCLCFAVLILLIVRFDDSRQRNESAAAQTLTKRPASYWWYVPLLFAFWANLHGSFLVGIVTLVCCLAGECVDTVIQTGVVTSLFVRREIRRWALLTFLALAGTLVNPYGSGLHAYTLTFSAHPNLKAILEWHPLTRFSHEWVPVFASLLLLMVVLRYSRVLIRGRDIILLGVFGLSVADRVRMISWYAVIFAFVISPHLLDIIRQIVLPQQVRTHLTAWLSRRSFSYGLLGGLMLWMTVSLSPVRQAVLARTSLRSMSLYSHLTPIAVTQYLRSHPPHGLVAAPQWWGDWLVWDGPTGLQLFTTTNSVHVVPTKIWRDYLAMASGDSELPDILTQYRVSTVVICKALQQQLARKMTAMNDWRVVFEDNMSIILEKNAATETDRLARDVGGDLTRE